MSSIYSLRIYDTELMRFIMEKRGLEGLVAEIISINDDTEYIEEVEEKDLRMYGVNGLIERRTKNHQDGLAVELDTKFFAEAKNAGTKFTPTKSEIAEEIEEAIQEIINCLTE